VGSAERITVFAFLEASLITSKAEPRKEGNVSDGGQKGAKKIMKYKEKRDRAEEQKKIREKEHPWQEQTGITPKKDLNENGLEDEWEAFRDENANGIDDDREEREDEEEDYTISREELEDIENDGPDLDSLDGLEEPGGDELEDVSLSDDDIEL
jgi:hypothetical protein